MSDFLFFGGGNYAIIHDKRGHGIAEFKFAIAIWDVPEINAVTNAFKVHDPAKEREVIGLLVSKAEGEFDISSSRGVFDKVLLWEFATGLG